MTGMSPHHGPYLHTYNMRSLAIGGRLRPRGRPQLRSDFAAERRSTIGPDSISKGLTVGLPSWVGCLWEPLALASCSLAIAGRRPPRSRLQSTPRGSEASSRCCDCVVAQRRTAEDRPRERASRKPVITQTRSRATVEPPHPRTRRRPIQMPPGEPRAMRSRARAE
jgi:hypothetical protein